MQFGFAWVERLGTLLAAVFAAVAFVLIAGWGPATAGEAASQIRLFSAAEEAHQGVRAFPKWSGVLARHAAEIEAQERDCLGCAVPQWLRYVDTLRNADALRQLQAVNAYVNRVTYRTDSARWGMLDHWATPREFFAGGGDCEDYAITKYLSLRRLGWRSDDLRIVVVRDVSAGLLHAVLVAYVNGTAYVLDNLAQSVSEHRSLRRYLPIFSLTENAWFFHPATPVQIASTYK
jgi:predicted transglutaminase-like cysteine proteinase